MELEKHIVIIGGGITGLSAAWEVQNHRQSRMRFSLLEADSNWGEDRYIQGSRIGRWRIYCF